jgi:chromosome segregation ATPase
MEISRTPPKTPPAQASAPNPPSPTSGAAASNPPARDAALPAPRADNGTQAAAAAPRGGALPALRDQLKEVNSELAGARNALAQATEQHQAYVQAGPQRTDQTFQKLAAAEERFIEAREKWTSAADPTSPALDQFRQQDKAAMDESRSHQQTLRNIPTELRALELAKATAQQKVDQLNATARDLQQAIRSGHKDELSAPEPSPTQGR